MRFACLAATFCFCALAVASAPTNWAWSDRFSPAFGCDGRVWAVERMDSGLIYCSGDFSHAGANEPPVLYVGGRFGQGGPFTAANIGRPVPLGDRIFRDEFSADP